jgi:hypothetical protein
VDHAAVRELFPVPLADCGLRVELSRHQATCTAPAIAMQVKSNKCVCKQELVR